MRYRLPALLLIALLIVACSTTPLGRRQLNLFPEAEMQKMGITAYDEMKANQPKSSDANVNQYVECVANRITAALGAAGGDKAWEVTVFKDDSANAFALPGGKMGVHTGLLKVAANQDQLATVLGHEVAHVLARHGNERVSQQYATNTGLELVRAIAGTQTAEKNALFGLLGVGAQFGVLMPFGRLQESEADLLGLDLMASAGFDPRQSTELWRNMGKASGGKQPPEFMSTHPSHKTRINDLEKRIPEALALREQALRQQKPPNCRMK